MDLLFFFLALLRAETSCSVCNIGGSLWSYNLTSSLYCPFSSICTNGCYKCEGSSVSANCMDTTTVINCLSHAKTCSNSYYNSASGTISYDVPLEVLCNWELDLREFNSNSDSIEISLKDQATKQSIIFVIVYAIPYTEFKPNLRDYIGSLYKLNASYLKVQGNYIVVVYWQSGLGLSKFNIQWKSENSEVDNSQLYLIIGVLIPCFVLCCCILFLYSYYKRKLALRVHPHMDYQIMNRSEEFNESFVEFCMPVRYHLKNDGSICPICFDNFSIGDEVRLTLCKHKFHSKCIDQWIESKPIQFVCPICKNNLFVINK